MINKTDKQLFLDSGFNEENWNFFSNYPRLFAMHGTFNDFALTDLRKWHQKFDCDSVTFSHIVKALHSRICFNKYQNDFSNDYPNLEKYNFIYFMDNIESLYLIEPIPKYTFGLIQEYLIQ